MRLSLLIFTVYCIQVHKIFGQHRGILKADVAQQILHNQINNKFRNVGENLPDRNIFLHFSYIHLYNENCFDFAINQQSLNDSSPLKRTPGLDGLVLNPQISIVIESLNENQNFGEGDLNQNQNSTLNCYPQTGIHQITPEYLGWTKTPSELVTQGPFSFFIHIQYRFPINRIIHIPDGVDAHLPYDLGQFQMTTLLNGRTVEVLIHYEINQSTFPLSAEPSLNRFFEICKNALNQSITIEKINYAIK